MPQFINETHSGVPVLVVDGELDISTQSPFHQALHALDTTAPHVLIDFCKCGYFDSSALYELCNFRRLRIPRQRVLIAMPSEFGRRILRITSVDAVFPIIDCVHAA